MHVFRRSPWSVAAPLLALLALAGPTWSQDAARGTVSGQVLTSTGQPAAGAEIHLVDLRRRVAADATGAFRFENVPAGEYVVQAESPRHGLSVTRVTVEPGKDASLEMTLDLATHQELIVVTARAGAQALSDVAQPVTSLTGADLTLRLQPTLGETLAQQPGVSSTYFGPGASRPVIRGLGGDRIRVLQDSIGTADASNTSPDHAVSFDPLSARQIEVVRGPATLLYGSNAVGGVVNVIDGRIPDRIPQHAVTGAVEIAGGSVAEEKSGAFSLNGGGGVVGWHADYFKRDSGDLKIPGFAESEALRREEEGAGEEHEEARDILENSAVESQGGGVALSLVGTSGYLGLGVSSYDTLYGVPGHAHEEEGTEEAAVRIDMEQRRLDLRGDLTPEAGPFRALRVRGGVADYEHVELEGEEVGTRFTNEAWEGRLEATHRPLGVLSGTLGLQLGKRDFEAIGAEAFIPPTKTRTWAVFAFEEVGHGPWRLQIGGRFDRQHAEAAGDAPDERTFSGASGSLGALWKGAAGYSFAATLARSVKLPTVEELFSNGPHIATRAFEIGDPDLVKEKSLGLDVAFRKTTGRVRGELSLFTNRFDDFIFEEFTGEEEDGLAVAQFVQRDADFMGAEASATFDLLHQEPQHLDLELSGDYVRAEMRATDQPLPRIPPLRYGAALHYYDGRWTARAEARGVAGQDRLGQFERPTESYLFLNASLGYRIFAGRSVVDILLRGTNLTDQEGRNHVSFLKDMVPLPGRDVRLSARVTF
jgi:iron complex outermembrane recepter protein